MPLIFAYYDMFISISSRTLAIKIQSGKRATSGAVGTKGLIRLSEFGAFQRSVFFSEFLLWPGQFQKRPHFPQRGPQVRRIDRSQWRSGIFNSRYGQKHNIYFFDIYVFDARLAA